MQFGVKEVFGKTVRHLKPLREPSLRAVDIIAKQVHVGNHPAGLGDAALAPDAFPGFNTRHEFFEPSSSRPKCAIAHPRRQRFQASVCAESPSRATEIPFSTEAKHPAQSCRQAWMKPSNNHAKANESGSRTRRATSTASAAY